jgi:hypothetical protein
MMQALNTIIDVLGSSWALHIVDGNRLHANGQSTICPAGKGRLSGHDAVAN